MNEWLIVYMFVVTERVCRQSHTLSGVTLKVTMLESQPDIDVCAVQVSGILPKHSRDFICLYFENSRSGGGTIDDIFVDHEEGIAVITFASASSMNLFCHVLLWFLLFIVSMFYFYCALSAY